MGLIRIFVLKLVELYLVQDTKGKYLQRNSVLYLLLPFIIKVFKAQVLNHFKSRLMYAEY
jgi:hypothetical protein